MISVLGGRSKNYNLNLYIFLIIVTYPFVDVFFFNFAGLNLRLYNIFTMAMVIGLFFIGINKRKIIKPTHIYSSLLFIISLSISVLVSEYQIFTIRYIILEFLGILLFWCITIYTSTSDRFFKTIRLSLWVANIVAVAIIVDMLFKISGLTGFFTSHHTHMLSTVGRATGLFAEPDRAGQYHLVFALWTLAFIIAPSSLKIYNKFITKRLIKFTFWINFFILFVSMVRAAWFGLAIGLFVCAFIYKKNNVIKIFHGILKWLFIVLIILLLSIAFITPWKDFAYQRLYQTIDEFAFSKDQIYSPTTSTIAYALFTFKRGLESPFIGHGWGTFPNYAWGYRYYNTRSIPAKPLEKGDYYEISWNRFAQIFYGAGFLGLLAYILWQFSIFRFIFNSKAPVIYRAAFLSVAIGMMWGFDQFRGITAYPPLYLFLGLACASDRIFSNYNKSYSFPHNKDLTNIS